MSDKFPKTYVIERLEARRESLKSKLDSGRKALADFQASKDPEAKAWLRTARKKLDNLVDDINPDGADAWEQVNKITSELYNLNSSQPRHPNNSWRGDRPAQVDEWRNRKDAWSEEVVKIDHALAYLKELPVSELSITALTKLKLTDAIAFDVRVDPKKTR